MSNLNDELFLYAVQLSREAAAREIHQSNLATIAAHDPAEDAAREAERCEQISQEEINEQ